MTVLLEGDQGAHCVVKRPSGLYVYKADVLEVYDADTITADVDLGLHVKVTFEKFRLFGINAPEMRGPEKPEGTVARDWLRDQILGKQILIETVETPKGLDKKGKFGRYLAKVFLPLADGAYLDLNKALVAHGFARAQEY